MESNESKKLLAMVHIVLAVIVFAVAIWQISVVKDFAPDYAADTAAFYTLFRMLTLSGLLWSVALATCAVSLLTEKRRTFCQLVSVVNLFLFPIGTIVGGLTLYALHNKREERTFTINKAQ